jgi:hypothetical protein
MLDKIQPKRIKVDIDTPVLASYKKTGINSAIHHQEGDGC